MASLPEGTTLPSALTGGFLSNVERLLQSLETDEFFAMTCGEYSVGEVLGFGFGEPEACYEADGVDGEGDCRGGQGEACERRVAGQQ